MVEWVIGTAIAVGAVLVSAIYGTGAFRQGRKDSTADGYKRIREWQRSHQVELNEAARREHASAVGGEPASRFLSRPQWRLAEPVDLAAITLRLVSEPVLGDEHFRALQRYWPRDATGKRLDRYHQVVSAHDKPENWFNGMSYRLTKVERLDSGDFRLDLSTMYYWDGLDSWGALSYEAARTLSESTRSKIAGSRIAGRYRRALKDPFDLTGRNCAVGISVLTVRRAADGSTFYLHRRTGGVAVLSGMTGCLPAGEFQPSDATEYCAREDLDIWRCMMREYAEELLGLEEPAEQRGGMIDYDGEPYARMQAGRDGGQVRPYVLDLGIDPLTWKAGIRLVYVWDAELFDRIFPDIVAENLEGRLVVPTMRREAGKPVGGWPLDEETVRRYLADPTITEAMKECLDLTWRHRVMLGLDPQPMPGRQVAPTRPVVPGTGTGTGTGTEASGFTDE